MNPYLTTREAAAFLRYHPKTLVRFIRAGELREGEHFVGRHRRRRWKRDALVAWIERTESTDAPEPLRLAASDVRTRL